MHKWCGKGAKSQESYYKYHDIPGMQMEYGTRDRLMRGRSGDEIDFDFWANQLNLPSLLLACIQIWRLRSINLPHGASFSWLCTLYFGALNCHPSNFQSTHTSSSQYHLRPCRQVLWTVLMTSQLRKTVLLPNTRELLEVSKIGESQGSRQFSQKHTYPWYPVHKNTNRRDSLWIYRNSQCNP